MFLRSPYGEPQYNGSPNFNYNGIYNQEIYKTYVPVQDSSGNISYESPNTIPQQNSSTYRIRPSDQYYYQSGYMPNVIDSNGATVSLKPINTGWHYNYYELYNQQQQYNQQLQQHRKEQMDLAGRLQKIVNRSFGISEETANENYAKSVERWNEAQQEMAENAEILNQQNLYNYIDNQAILSSSPEYKSMAYANYLQRWGQVYEARNKNYPTNYSMYDFFNNGIGENMYMDMIEAKAEEKRRQLCNLYDKNAFRQELSRLHPSYDPYDGSIKPSERLTIDDMEVTLPASISSAEYQKRRERFFSSIIQSSIT